MALESLAGTEILFRDMFLETARLNIPQTLILSGKHIHPEIKKPIETYTPIYSLSKWGGVKLPKIDLIRDANFERILLKHDTNIVVGWNKFSGMQKISKDVKYIHYEHSVCWFDKHWAPAQKLLDRSNLIIAVSKASKRLIEIKYGHKLSDKIVINKNPLPTSRMRIVPRIENKKIKIGYAARFAPVKGPWVAIHTLHHLKKKGIEFEAHFAGTGELLEATKKLAQDLGVLENCHFLGPVTDMNSFYAQMDYLLCPSLCEPFGLSPLEAMRQGCLPLVCRVDGLVEVVGKFQDLLSFKPVHDAKDILEMGGTMPEGISVVYNPDTDKEDEIKCASPKEMAERIYSFESDRAYKFQLLTEVQNYVEENFQMQDTIQRQLQYYRHCLENC